MSGKRQGPRETDAALRRRWIDYARQHLVGRTITGVEYLTAKEARELDWVDCPVVLCLDNGTQLIPWRDDEGNGAGTLAGQTADDQLLLFPVLRVR